jgi:predicted dehydrogenase
LETKTKIGVIGCGNISDAYFAANARFSFFDVAACADLNPAAAQAKAQQWNVPRACGVDELLADEEIEFVVNLTIPRAHEQVLLACLQAGKHVYTEKPFTVTREGARQVMARAAECGRRVGSAPDTFLGGAHQTCRKLIDEGAIGEPVAATAFMACHGHEHWHPSPEFYYQAGGGPMFDMGPYYLTALLNLLGPAKRIAGMASVAIPDRTITSQPKHGTKITVQTPDHVVGLMEFANGAVGTITQSFAVIDGGYDGSHPILINGTEGAIYVPDPNGFDGTVKVRRLGDRDATDVPHLFVTGYGRSVGLADMAVAIRTGRPHRCDGRQAFAVLDLMQGFLDSSATGTAHRPTTAYARPAPMPAHLPFGQLDT